MVAYQSRPARRDGIYDKSPAETTNTRRGQNSGNPEIWGQNLSPHETENGHGAYLLHLRLRTSTVVVLSLWIYVASNRSWACRIVWAHSIWYSRRTRIVRDFRCSKVVREAIHAGEQGRPIHGTDRASHANRARIGTTGTNYLAE